MGRKVIQKSHDPATRLPNIWLGAKGAVRWPFDATFDQWYLGMRLAALSSILFWIIVPQTLVYMSFAWLIAAKISKSFEEQKRMRLIIFGMLTFLIVSFVGFSSMLRPMNIILAAVFGIVAGVVIAVKLGHHITEERPFRYWMNLPAVIAAGPRERTPGQTFTLKSHYIAPDAPVSRKVRVK